MTKSVGILLKMAKASAAVSSRSFRHRPSSISTPLRSAHYASTVPLPPPRLTTTATTTLTRRRSSLYEDPSFVISSFGSFGKVFGQRAKLWPSNEMKSFHSSTSTCDQVNPTSECAIRENLQPETTPENVESVDASGSVKVKRKKLKGKRAVVRWLKYFRWKKKKEYERMTAEEKILYKLKKAHNKEAQFVDALKKLDPPDTSEATHDPEILTPEEHFYFLKMGRKSRNYVPIGRRGIYQGVILNMHLHWKKHQTLKVIVKTFTPEEVCEIAAELARLSGGIVLDIYDEDTIIMYRGKNYVQPPTEIMSPKITLSRRKMIVCEGHLGWLWRFKALDKSKYRESLREVRKYIPRLEQELENLKEQAQAAAESKSQIVAEESPDASNKDIISKHRRLEQLLAVHENSLGMDDHSDDCLTESSAQSESEALSDILETDSEQEADEKDKKHLYLDEIEKFPSKDGYIESVSFEEQLQQISAAWKNSRSSRRDEKLELDEVDKLFLRAGSLLRKKGR